MQTHDEQLAALRSAVMDDAEKTGRIEWTLEPSAPTKGKSAKQLDAATFKVTSGATEVTTSLAELTRLVIFCRENLPNARHVQSGGRVTKPYSAPVRGNPTTDQIEEALGYLRRNRWIE